MNTLNVTPLEIEKLIREERTLTARLAEIAVLKNAEEEKIASFRKEIDRALRFLHPKDALSATAENIILLVEELLVSKIPVNDGKYFKSILLLLLPYAKANSTIRVSFEAIKKHLQAAKVAV